MQKGLFIANLAQTKFYPKRRSLMKEKKRKKVGIVLIAIIVLCIIGIIASPSDDKKMIAIQSRQSSRILRSRNRLRKLPNQKQRKKTNPQKLME